MMISINRYMVILLVSVIAGFVAYHMGILGFTAMMATVFSVYLISKMLKMQDKNENQEKDLTALYEDIDGLSLHLEELNQMHVYHMDDNILALIKHSRGVLDTLIDFQIEYSTEPVEIIDDKTAAAEEKQQSDSTSAARKSKEEEEKELFH